MMTPGMLVQTVTDKIRMSAYLFRHFWSLKKYWSIGGLVWVPPQSSGLIRTFATTLEAYEKQKEIERMPSNS